MRKKSVSFFEQVRIREINICDDQLLEEYHEDLVKDYGDYNDKSLNNAERRRSLLGKSVDFSGTIYSSSTYDAQTDRYPSKLLLLPSLKADRWQSTSTGKISLEADECKDQPENDSRERPRRKQEDDPCLKDSSMPAVPIRVSSNEELTTKAMSHSSKTRSSGLPPLPIPNSSFSPSLRRKITSAPSLARLKRRSKKSYLSVSESRNATFGNNSYSYKNKPPSLPTRWNSLLDRVNSKSSSNSNNNNEITRHSMESCSSNTSATTLMSVDSNPSVDNLGIVTTPSLDSDRDYKSEEFSLSTIEIAESPRSRNRRSLLQRGFGSFRSLTSTNSPNPNNDKSFSSLPEREYRSEEFSPSSMKATMESIPESPSSGNRRNLLQRGFGSLRSLTIKPMSRYSRNDLPPVRPIRTTSVRVLELDDTL
jgi:hypothetical protein